jgi:hypothetical protein
MKSPPPKPPTPRPSDAAGFAATRWTVVLAAARGQQASSPAAEAMAELCRVYWYSQELVGTSVRGHLPGVH